MSDDIVVNTDELTANDTVVVDMPQIGGTVEITFGVGPQGLEGDRGPRGYLFTPTVSEEGVISWTNDGNLPNPEPISIKGPKGDKGDPISIHICSSGEYDPTTRVPTVQNPESNVFYLVPAEDPQSTDLFSEWVYVNGAWELFGSAKVDLSGYAMKADTVLETTLSRGRQEGSIIGEGSVAFGNEVTASGNYSFASGVDTIASGIGSHAEGFGSTLACWLTGEANSLTYDYTLDSPQSGIKPNGRVTWRSPNGELIIRTITSIDYANKTLTLSESLGDYVVSNVAVSYSASGACGNYSHVEGSSNTAAGYYSHVEGQKNVASNYNTHAEGSGNIAHGRNAHVEGRNNIARGDYSHVEGQFNVEDYVDLDSVEEWIAGHRYEVGDTVKRTSLVHGIEITYVYVCQRANSDSSFKPSKWEDPLSTYVHIVGNGTSKDARSNAYALDWDGNGHYMGDVYVGANSDSSGGTKVATVDDIAAIEVPVNDVQVNSVSVVDANGVANVPIATSSVLGVVKSNSDGGVAVGANGALRTDAATVSHIKAQSNTYKPIAPANEYAAAFYGLATASGDTTQKSSANPVGTYTDEAKAAIQQMLGVPQVATTEEVEEIITAYEEDEDMVFEMTFENLGHGEGRYTSVETTETIMNAYYAGKHVVLHFPEVSDFGVIGECWASIIGANKDDNRLYCSTMLNGEELTEMIISGDHVLVEIFS